MSFTFEVKPVKSNNQAAYDAIQPGAHRFTVVLNQAGTTGSVTTTTPVASMEGVMNGEHAVLSGGILGQIIDINSVDGKVSFYEPYTRVVRTAKVEDYLGMTLTTHISQFELDAINKAMADTNTKAVELTFDLAPLSIWTKETIIIKNGEEVIERVPCATAFGKLVTIQPLALDSTVSQTDGRSINGQQMRAINNEVKLNRSSQKRAARQQVGASTTKPTINLSTLSQSAVTTVQ